MAGGGWLFRRLAPGEWWPVGCSALLWVCAPLAASALMTAGSAESVAITACIAARGKTAAPGYDHGVGRDRAITADRAITIVEASRLRQERLLRKQALRVCATTPGARVASVLCDASRPVSAYLRCQKAWRTSCFS